MKTLSRALTAIFLSYSGFVHAADEVKYPTRAIRTIVGFTPGGGNDIIARIVGQKLSEGLGQPVIIGNKPGAGAVLAAEYVARSAPDGYALLVGASGAMAIDPAVSEKLSYDTIRDFTPVRSSRIEPAPKDAESRIVSRHEKRTEDALKNEHF